MKNAFMALAVISLFSLASCSKDECNCTAFSADGVEMYEVVGSDLCMEQIDPTNGETCSCDCDD